MKAFPTTRNNEQTGIWQTEDGMDLRDYFAAKPMSQMFDLNWIDSGTIEEVDLDHLAKWSYVMADAMMKARTA